MNAYKKLLPSISMLAALEVTAKKGSFSLAAEELNVTHGAVSRQIQALENQLGVTLFVRSARGVRLTDIGKEYAAEIHAVLGALRDATLKVVSDPKGSTLDLAVLPSFGTRWLIPRLPGFMQQYPDITVNFVTRHPHMQFEEDHVDAAIYNCVPDWDGAKSSFLLGECPYPACSPILSRRLGGELDPGSPDLPLLGLKSRPNDWQDWFASVGVEKPLNSNTMVFEHFSALAHAAVAGLGIALLPRFLIDMELERGTLVILSERPSADEMSYYLVTPASKQNYEPLRLFREWLGTTIEQEKKDRILCNIAPANSESAELLQ